MSKTRIYALLLPLLVGCTALRQRTAENATAAAPQRTFKNIRIAASSKMFDMGPCEPTICINPRNPQQVAAGAILNEHYWSDDGGRTWQNGDLKSSFGVFGDPVIIADTAGAFYYAHLSDPEGKGWSSERLLDRIVVQRSTDGGRSYDDGSYMGMRHPKDQDKQWLCVDPRTNAIYSTWTEFDVYGSKDTVRHKSRILFARSTDNGKTWSEAQVISQFEGDCLDDDNTPEGAVPAVGPDGTVYVAWAWNNRLWFDRSTDGGRTWLAKDLVIGEQPGGWTFDIPGITRCNGMPVLVCDLSNGPNRGTLYVNWSDQRNGADDTDVWLARSTDGGQTWSAALRINDDAKGRQQFLTWLAVDQTTGFLYTVFYDRRAYDDERTDVYLAVSRDGGRTFENLKISESPFDPVSFIFFGDYNHISAHAGMVRPIWTRLENNVLSVWTALIDFK
jgi:hypothetical protein